LVDILPTIIVPTWHNGRSGSVAIKKRLDRVFVSESLATMDGRIRSWVEHPFVFYHAPVLLQLETSPIQKAHSFKLNSSWLQEDSFSAIVKEVWTDPLFHAEPAPQLRLVWKLKLFKTCIKQWARSHRHRIQARLSELELNIQHLLLLDTTVGALSDMNLSLQRLESERNTLLLVEEARWRQRSCATWIRGDDLNTNFFHRYASSKENKNHIWQILDDSSSSHSGQFSLKVAATAHYHSYAAPSRNLLQDSINVASIFPHFVTAEDKNLLDSPCTLQEPVIARFVGKVKRA
jgi:hypothetical protein